MPKKRPLFDPAKLEALKRAHDAYNTNHVPYGSPEYNANLPRSRHLAELFHNAHIDIFEEPFESAWSQFWNGDYSSLDVLIQFLEEDPYFFRSGYMKEALLRRLSVLHLGGSRTVRLRKLCLWAVDSCARRDFRGYCTLASRIADKELVEAVARRLENPESPVRWRAQKMLHVISLNAAPDLRHIAEERLSGKPAHGSLRPWAGLPSGKDPAYTSTPPSTC